MWIVIYIEERTAECSAVLTQTLRGHQEMISQTEAGLARELQAIITLYLGTLLGGYSMGFSAIAIPDMKNDMMRN